MRELARAVQTLQEVSFRFDCFPLFEMPTVRVVLRAAAHNTRFESLELCLPGSCTMPFGSIQERDVAKQSSRTFAQAMSQLPALRSLKLHNIHQLEASPNVRATHVELHNSLVQLSQLTQLSLTCDKMSNISLMPFLAVYQAKPLAKCIASMQALHCLELVCHVKSNVVNCRHREHLFRAIANLPILSRLVLNNVFSSSRMNKSLFQCNKTSPGLYQGLNALRELHVGGVGSIEKCFQPLAASTRVLRALESLTVQCESFEDNQKHLQLVQVLVDQPSSPLTSLSLHYDSLFDRFSQAEEIVKAIMQLSTLQQLTLQLSIVGTAVCEVSVSSLSNLTSLSLLPSKQYHPSLPKEIPLYILPVGLESLGALRHLSLDGVVGPVPKTEALMRSIGGSSSLECLELKEFGFPALSQEAFSNALSKLTRLTRLSLQHQAGCASWSGLWANVYSDTGFLCALCNMKELRELEIRAGNALRGTAQRTLCNPWFLVRLHKLPNLRSLVLENLVFYGGAFLGESLQWENQGEDLLELKLPEEYCNQTGKKRKREKAKLPHACAEQQLCAQASLTRLSLSGCRLFTEREFWGPWISSMHNLRVLDVSNLDIKFSGGDIKDIFHGMSKNDIFQKDLMKAIATLSKLRSVTVEGGELGDGVAHWAEVLQNAPELRYIGPLGVSDAAGETQIRPADASGASAVRDALSLVDPLRCSRLASKCGMYYRKHVCAAAVAP